ncbi:MAG TPA: hypothetical protein VKU19_11730 [Bryobacteraceae bacterium]|nr:hypothetical protein [Bryobacteraceae bacterium]
MILRRFRFAPIALVALSAAGAFAQTSSSNTVTRSLTSPPIGLGSSETAQVNVVNTASNSSSGTAASCTGSISFVNASGTTIGTASTFTVTTGQISAATLPFSRVGATGVRTEVRAVVSLTFTSGSNVPCDLVTSFETFDTASGATHLHLEQSGGIEGPGFGGRN